MIMIKEFKFSLSILSFIFFSSVQNDINLLSDLNCHRKLCIMRGHMNSDVRVSYKCSKVHLAYTDKHSVYRLCILTVREEGP